MIGFSNIEVISALDKSSVGRIEKRSITGVDLRENGREGFGDIE